MVCFLDVHHYILYLIYQNEILHTFMQDSADDLYGLSVSFIINNSYIYVRIGV